MAAPMTGKHKNHGFSEAEVCFSIVLEETEEGGPVLGWGLQPITLPLICISTASPSISATPGLQGSRLFLFCCSIILNRASLVVQLVQNLPAIQETRVQSLS